MAAPTVKGYVPDSVTTARGKSVQQMPISLPPTHFIFKFLRNPANNSTDMAVDGSSTPVNFRYTCPVGKMAILARMLVHIVDAKVDPVNYGGIAGPLTNGLLVAAYDSDDTLLMDFLDTTTILDQTQWGHVAGSDIKIHAASGATDWALNIRWTFGRTGSNMCLNAGQYIQVTIQDDLSPLTHHDMALQGILVHAE